MIEALFARKDAIYYNNKYEKYLEKTVASNIIILTLSGYGGTITCKEDFNRTMFDKFAQINNNVTIHAFDNSNPGSFFMLVIQKNSYL